MATTSLTISPTTRHTPLALWHLLSLDAPTVATLWTIFAARTLHQPLPPTLPVTMFLAVWLLYAADRLLDTRTARPLKVSAQGSTRNPCPWVPQVPARSHREDPGIIPSPHLQPRHHFHRAHRLPFAFGILLAAFALAILVPTLPLSLLRSYLLLAALLAAWFALIHLTCIPLPKEFAPGPFFAAAVFVPFHPGPIPPILFAALCTLNCLYIHAWEHPAPFASTSSFSPLAPPAPHLRRSHIVPKVGLGAADRSRPTHPATRQALRHLLLLTLAVALLPSVHPTPITLAITLSATALLILHHWHHRLPPTTLRAAADLALLTPLLVLPFLA